MLEGCSLNATWAEVRDATIAILERTTFADLARRARRDGGRNGRTGCGAHPPRPLISWSTSRTGRTGSRLRVAHTLNVPRQLCSPIVAANRS